MKNPLKELERMSIFSKVTKGLRDESMAGEGFMATRKLDPVYDILYKIAAAGFSLFFLYTTFAV